MKELLSITRKLLNEAFMITSHAIEYPKFHTYEKAKEIIDEYGKTDGYSTIVNLHNKIIRLERHSVNGEICIFYHSTGVICFDQIGNIELNVRSYYTPSTKNVINHFLPPGVGIDSIKGKWHVFAKNGTFPYHNGIKLNEEGDVISDVD